MTTVGVILSFKFTVTVNVPETLSDGVSVNVDPLKLMNAGKLDVRVIASPLGSEYDGSTYDDFVAAPIVSDVKDALNAGGKFNATITLNVKLCVAVIPSLKVTETS